jgi:hypothetical protein
MKNKIASWLRDLPDVSEAMPIEIRLGIRVYEGARYVQRGEDHIYLAGTLPASYKRSDKECYVLAGDGREWFIAGYWQDNNAVQLTPEQIQQYHPFGKSIILVPWTAPEKIDRHAKKPYRRVSAKIIVGG